METHPYKSLIGLKIQLNLSEIELFDYNFSSGGIWFPNTQVIICGTFPPKKEYYKRKGYLYFSSSRNKFWKHIDNLFACNLFISKNISDIPKLRIKNSLEKIIFAEKHKIGFIDFYSSITRRYETSSKDIDIIKPYVTIFETTVFEEILKSSVRNIVFVYRKCFEDFLCQLKIKYPKLNITVVRNYNTNNYPLKVISIELDSNSIYLSYSPIHGRILDKQKRAALKKALEFDFS